MKEIITESYGKINLALDVLYKRDDGYHEINSVMQQINLGDKLTFKAIKEGCIIESNNRELPLDSRNLIYKAWEELCLLTEEKRGIHITVDKKIPICAGLGGGSSNCATTLKVLNHMWNIGLSMEELMDIGKGLGADVPFCIMGGTALAKGIGEKLTKLDDFSGHYILLGTPDFGVSTKEAFAALDLNKDKFNLENLILSMERNDLKSVGTNLKNKMEEQIIKKHPIVLDIKNTMINNGALGALMSGSGPTVFGLFEDKEKMLWTKNKLLKKIDKIYISKTI